MTTQWWKPRRLLTAAVVSALCLGGAASAEAHPTAAGGKAATYNWQMQVVAPSNNPNGQASGLFAQLVNQFTNGQINVAVHYSVGLGLSLTQMVDLTSRRSVDVGELIGQFVESSFPESNLPSIPGLIPFDVATRERVAAALAPYYAKLLAPKNIVYLGYCQAGSRSIISRKPVQSLSDLKGVKISANGGASEAALTSAIGANPVTNLVTAEIYPALQTGVVDAAWAPDTFIDSAKFYEVAKILYDAAIGGSTVMWTINGDDWKQLTPALQADVRKASAQAIDRCYKLNDSSQTQSVVDLRTHGVTVVTPSAADRKTLAQLTAPLANAWAATHGPNAPNGLHIVQAALGAKSVIASLKSSALSPRPKRAARASASFSAVLTPTATGGDLQFSFTAKGLSGPVTGVEIVGGTPGKKGVPSAKVCTKCQAGKSISAVLPKGLYRIVYTGRPAYAVITTKANPAGEVAGRVKVARLTK